MLAHRPPLSADILDLDGRLPWWGNPSESPRLKIGVLADGSRSKVPKECLGTLLSLGASVS